MLPKTGNKLHRADPDLAFAAMLADALTTELGLTHQAVKKVMRWSGASERSVKHWLAGTHAPSGAHLVALLRHSDQVLRRVLIAAGRQDMLLALEVAGLRAKLVDVLTAIDGRATGAP